MAQFKVADDGEQTYISQEEAREGDKLSGTYSYVDSDGALVTVNYEAGAMGYSETRDKQEGFVQMRARPVRTQTLAVENSAAGTAARARAAQAVTASRQSSSINQNAIISQVISSLQPLITRAV